MKDYSGVNETSGNKPNGHRAGKQFTMQTQQDLCTLHPNHGIMNIDVLSFGRMAHRIFEEVGQSRGQVLDDEGKNLILRKIAGQYEDRLEGIKRELEKQGYISEVKSVILSLHSMESDSKSWMC